METPAKAKPMSQDEVHTLVELIQNQKAIIFSKETNAKKNKEKDESWEYICQYFNDVTETGVNRTKEQLKAKWDNLKKASRKRSERIKLNKTDEPPDEILDTVAALLDSGGDGGGGESIEIADDYEDTGSNIFQNYILNMANHMKDNAKITSAKGEAAKKKQRPINFSQYKKQQFKAKQASSVKPILDNSNTYKKCKSNTAISGNCTQDGSTEDFILETCCTYEPLTSSFGFTEDTPQTSKLTQDMPKTSRLTQDTPLPNQQRKRKTQHDDNDKDTPQPSMLTQDMPVDLPTTSIVATNQQRKRKISQQNEWEDDVVNRLVQHLDERENKKQKVDVIDNLFSCYADTFKKFPPREQALVKLELAKLFTDFELRLYNSNADPLANSNVSIESEIKDES